MKRILELFGEPISIGGQETYVVNHVLHMDKSGMQVDCLTPYTCESEAQRKKVNSWGGEVYELGLPFMPGKSREYVASHLSKFLDDKQYDVVHIHSGSTSMLAIAADRVKEKTTAFVIVHSHNAADRMTLKKQIIRCLYAPKMMQADMLCACSEKAAESKFIPSVQAKVKILRNGIDSRKFINAFMQRRQTRAELLNDNSTFVLTHVGRLAPEKNHSFILDVFSHLVRLKHNVVLWLIGEGQERKNIEARVGELGLESQVRLFGSRDDIEALLAASDAFIFPSRFEGLPFSLLEAQASGLHCYVNGNVINGCVVDSKLIHSMSLEDAPKKWASEIAALDTERLPGSQVLFENAGFDISQSSQILEQIYRFPDEYRVNK